ncbi:MAG: N-acetyltransferase [Myxococcales bacterium]|nr:N-acetyltransferase [Myxococcales bacterium]
MRSEVEVVRVPLHDRKLVERFIRVPWFIHRELYPNQHWVPPLLLDRREFLDPSKNPFFTHAEVCLWIARKGGRDVGRIAAVRDQAWLDFHGDRTGYFGMFEAPDDPAVAGALLDAARRWLRNKGLDKMIGPMDLSTNYVCGVLIDAFDRDPGINMPYNPPWYDALLKSQGLSKAKDLIQWGIELSTPIPPRVVRIAEKLKQREGVVVRAMRFDDWDAEVGRAFEVYNDAWEHNWGFVPVTEAEFRHIAKDLKMVLDPSLPLVAEVDGKPVAFALIIMNVNPTLKKLDGKLLPTGVLRLLWDLKVKKVVDSGRLILLGIREGYRRRGLDSILFLEMAQRAKALGWWGGEIGWTLEDNVMVNRAIENFGSKAVAHYRIYGEDLVPASPETDDAESRDPGAHGNEGIAGAESGCGGEGG